MNDLKKLYLILHRISNYQFRSLNRNFERSSSNAISRVKYHELITGNCVSLDQSFDGAMGGRKRPLCYRDSVAYRCDVVDHMPSSSGSGCIRGLIHQVIIYGSDIIWSVYSSTQLLINIAVKTHPFFSRYRSYQNYIP